jgi:hypothetical protein
MLIEKEGKNYLFMKRIMPIYGFNVKGARVLYIRKFFVRVETAPFSIEE